MEGIFRKSYHFTKDNIAHNEALGFKTRTVEAEVRIVGSQNIQVAPDWIRDTTLFKLGVQDKMITELTTVKTEAPQQPGTPQPPTGAPSGFGAGPQTQQTGFQTQQPGAGSNPGFTAAPAFGAGQNK